MMLIIISPYMWYQPAFVWKVKFWNYIYELFNLLGHLLVQDIYILPF